MNYGLVCLHRARLDRRTRDLCFLLPRVRSCHARMRGSPRAPPRPGEVTVIGLIAVTSGGRAAAARLAAAWPGQTRSYDGPARQALPSAWAQCDALVCFLAVGATVRLIAPLLDSKWTDPAVVCVDESARHAVAVVGGHAAGANALAAKVAEVFRAAVVITTATDALSL